MKYVRRFILWPLLVLLTLIACLVFYFANTGAGLQQSLKLAQEHAPGTLTWEKAEGKYFGPLDLEQLSFLQPDGMQVKLQRASFDWTPSALFSRTLKLNKLHLSGLEMHLPPTTETAEPEPDEGPFELPDIQLPIDISLNDIRLSDIKIFPHGAEEPIVVENVELVAAGENDQMRLVNLNVQAPEAEATLKGYIQPQGAYPLELALNWQYHHPEFGNFTGKGDVAGSLQDLNIQHTIQGAAEIMLDGTVKNSLNAPDWNIRLSANSEDLGAFSSALVNAPLAADIQTQGTLEDFRLSGDIKTSLDQTGPVALTLATQGDTRQLTIESLLLALKKNGGRLRLSGPVSIEKQSAELEGEWHKLSWPVDQDPEFFSEAGTFSFNGDAKDFTLLLNTEIDGKLLSPLNASADITGQDQNIQIKALSLKGQESPLDFSATGSVDIAKQALDLSGKWDALNWPMQGAPEFSSPSGKFSAKGLFTDYQFEVQTALDGKAIPQGDWNITGTGTDKSLPDFTVSGKTLGGEISTAGTASWAPTVNWDVNVTGSTINPGLQWPDFPGSLNMALASKGTLTDKGPSLTANIQRLDGTLKDKPVNGRGDIVVEGQNINIDQLTVSSGGTELLANGSLSNTWDLNFQLNAPELKHWSKDVGGSFSAKGQMTGTPQQPAIQLEFNGAKIKAGTNSVASIVGQANIDASGKQHSNVDIVAKDLKAAEQKVQAITLKGDGKPERHRLDLQLTSDSGNLETAVEGGLKDNHWTGVLKQLSALKTEFGDWRLEQPANLAVSPGKASLENACLGSAPTRLCLKGDWDSEKGRNGSLDLSDLEPKRFKAFFPEGLMLDNKIQLNAKGRVSPSGRIRGNADIQLSEGQLLLGADDAPSIVALGESRINTQLNGEKANAKAALDLGKLGTFNADLGLNGLSDKGRLSGSLSPRLTDLSLISTFAPQLQEVSGSFTGDLRLGGTVAEPLVEGQLDLKDFNAEVPQVAINVEDTHLHIQGDGNSPLTISGSSRSGEGKLNLQGKLNPKTKFFDMTIKGDNYVVADSSHLRARISPDMQIAMNQDGMSVTGKLEVPQAFVDAKGGSSGIDTVSGSGDIVIIDKNGAREPSKAAENLNVNLQIVLGDDIKVEAGDFSGKLKGNLLVEQTPQLAPRGTGTIEVFEGDYVIYGQQLTMQRGRILFSGGPIDNPRLDMDVARRVEAYDVLAGAQVRGTAQAPLLQLYSEPAMPDASILSYILLGQPPGTKGGSYTLGKFITPDLYVSYGIGLFNAINTFNMRYKLTEKLSVQAASGLANSADLIYTIER